MRARRVVRAAALCYTFRMETIAKADIFFFITSVAVILLALLGAAALVYAIRILRSIRKIADLAQHEAQNLSQDIQDLRDEVKKEGGRLGGAIKAFARMLLGKKNRSHHS